MAGIPCVEAYQFVASHIRVWANGRSQESTDDIRGVRRPASHGMLYAPSYQLAQDTRYKGDRPAAEVGNSWEFIL